MLNRERIIILLMLASIVYGAYSLFMAPSDNIVVEGSKKRIAELKSFVVDAATSLSNEYVSATDKYIIQKAEKSWPQNPFLQSATPLTSQPYEAHADVTIEQVKLSYTGFIQTSDSMLAIVNELEYEAGEQLNVGDFYIKSISPDRLMIGIGNDPKTIILPLDEAVSIPLEAKE